MTRAEALKKQHQTEQTLLTIRQTLDTAGLSAQEANMAVSAEVQQLITEFDEATTAISDRIQRLVTKLDTQGSLSADDKAALEAEVTGLRALGQDPVNPVPKQPTFAPGMR